jgi:hypothetical protein
MTKHYPKGLDGRQQDRNGQIREKRAYTLVGTLRGTYGPEFAPGYLADAKLGTVLRQEGAPGLDQLRRRS